MKLSVRKQKTKREDMNQKKKYLDRTWQDIPIPHPSIACKELSQTENKRYSSKKGPTTKIREVE